MVTHKKKYRKVKKKVLFLSAAASTSVILFTVFLLSIPQKVEIIYFRNDKCELVHNTDNIINEAAQIFGNSITIKTINAQLYPTEPNDTEEVKQQREKYNVIGLPDIIINRKKFTKEFTRSNLFAEICNNFIVKPEVC